MWYLLWGLAILLINFIDGCKIMARFMGKKSLGKSHQNLANCFKKSIKFFNRSNISIEFFHQSNFSIDQIFQSIKIFN